jgi:hypothetical protein
MVNLSTYNLQKGQSTAMMINVEVPVYVSSHMLLRQHVSQPEC